MADEDRTNLSLGARKLSLAALAIAALLTQSSASVADTPFAKALAQAQLSVASNESEGTGRKPPPLSLQLSTRRAAVQLGHSSHSSHASHASHYSGTGDGGGADPAPPPPPPKSPPAGGDPPATTQPVPNVIYVITMKDERVFKGTVKATTDKYIITMKEGVIRVAKADVASIRKADEDPNSN